MFKQKYFCRFEVDKHELKFIIVQGKQDQMKSDSISTE